MARERQLDELVRHARMMSADGLGTGTAGNISIRLGDEIVMTLNTPYLVGLLPARILAYNVSPQGASTAETVQLILGPVF